MKPRTEIITDSSVEGSIARSVTRNRFNPPGPANNWWWPWWQTPNLFLMKAGPVGYMTKLGHRYGDICSFLLFSQRGYILNSPRLIKDFLTGEPKDFEKAAWQMKPLRDVVGDGLLTSSGELWKRQRRLIQSAFRLDSLPSYASISVDLTNSRIRQWQDASVVDLGDEMNALSMGISIQTNLGIHAGEESSKIAQAILNVAENLKIDMESIVTLPRWLPFQSSRSRRAKQDKQNSLKLIDHYIRDVITKKRAEQSGGEFNVLHKLLDAVDEEGDGMRMSRKLVRDEALTMMIAGNHSVSATLAWTWALLMNHQDVLYKVEHEVLSELGDRTPEFNDLKQLPYLVQVVQETLRLFPSAWILFCRQAIRDTWLGPHRIRKGGWLFTVPFVTHRDERFFPDALRFDPDRFSEERINDIPQHAYFPFGTGPHVCVGKHLAMTQLPLIIATIIQKFSIRPLSKRPSLEISRDLAIRPREGCPVRVTRRTTIAKKMMRTHRNLQENL